MIQREQLACVNFHVLVAAVASPCSLPKLSCNELNEVCQKLDQTLVDGIVLAHSSQQPLDNSPAEMSKEKNRQVISRWLYIIDAFMASVEMVFCLKIKRALLLACIPYKFE